MAVDTRNKRSSVISFQGTPLFPNPDGDITGQADRQHMLSLYSREVGVVSPTPCVHIANLKLISPKTTLNLISPKATIGLNNDC